ncbi:MAG: type I-C CRISPR-associated endonuclease Cas1c [Candidatus Spyradocola sp.]
MRRLLNTLFVTTSDAYLSLDGENIVASREGQTLGRFPLHNLFSVVSFSYAGASPALMGACAERGIDMVFCSPQGRFLARTAGIAGGNVLLRREQYRAADDPSRTCSIARYMVYGKLYNARWNIERVRRDHAQRIDGDKFRNASAVLKNLLPQVEAETSPDSLRGLEGTAATAYFAVLDDMILRDKQHFRFHGRSRRPPLDRFNALLSFAYSLLAHDCASALESAGLDSYVGFLHRDRPGRTSLALDLMEELRPCMADRFVLTLVNNRVMQPEDFHISENGAVRLTDDARSRFLKNWQQRKQETITHPFLEEKMPWGMVPYVQALLLARTLRGDLEDYSPFLWK